MNETRPYLTWPSPEEYEELKEKQKMLLERAVFRMYIKDNCPYCDKAKDIILKELKCSLHSVNITNDPSIRKLVIKETGQKTVPVIYLGDEFIGGCDDLAELCKSDGFQTKVLREEVNVLRNEVIELKRNL